MTFQRDFTLSKYRELCQCMVGSGYSVLRVRDYLCKRGAGDDIVILRHDVDRRPEKALQMALLESELGITSTYYFRMTEGVFKPGLIREIASLGHEIGYHYEVLDKARGDMEKAVELFRAELSELRRIVDVETVAMHGNPLSTWVNSDIWLAREFEEFELLGDPYLSIDYGEVAYLSDTGRSWDGRYSVKDVVNRVRRGRLRTTDDVIGVFRLRGFSKVCVIAHPSRWNEALLPWIVELAGQSVKNLGKAGVVWLRKRRMFDAPRGSH